MEATLGLYQPGAQFLTAPIQELRVHGPSVIQGMPSVITWSVVKPQPLRVYTFQVDILFQDIFVGRVDWSQWAFSHFGGGEPWRWILPPSELEQIEERQRGNDLSLTLKCHGIVSLMDQGSTPPPWIPVHGATQLQVPRSEWESVLVQLGYEPAHYLTLPVESQHWPNWAETVREMEAAVRALARGETHEALRHCLMLFEKQKSAPYQAESWKGVFDVDSQKERALSELISGIATYLNLVGHHYSKTERDSRGNLRQSAVDQFEAEVMVAMTQLMIAYLHRLPRMPSE